MTTHDDLSRQSLIDSLDSPAAVVDPTGVVRLVNRAWRRFGHENGAPDCEVEVDPTSGPPADDTCGLGVNYAIWLDDPNDEFARRAAVAVFDVIEGRAEQVDLVYPCHAPHEQRWFRLLVAPLSDAARRSVLAVHIRLDPDHGAREFGVDAPPVRPQRTICAWCGAREKRADGTWDAMAGPIEPHVAVSHGICPSCSDEQLTGLDDGGSRHRAR